MGEQVILAGWPHCLSEQTWGSVNQSFSYLLLHAHHPQTQCGLGGQLLQHMVYIAEVTYLGV